MESSRNRNEGRNYEIRYNFKAKSSCGSLSTLNPDDKIHHFINNGIIDDEKVSDTDTCNSPHNIETNIFYNDSNLNSDSDATSNLTFDSKQLDDENNTKYNNDVDTTSCKPCSVILKRLSDEELSNLLSRNDLGVKNVKKNKRRNQRFLFQLPKRRKNGRLVSFGKLKDPPNSKKTDYNRSDNGTTRKKLNRVQSSSSSDKTIQSDDESNGSYFNERMNKSYLLFENNKVDSDNSNTIEYFNKHESSSISREDSERKVSPSKRLSLSRKKNKIIDMEEDDNCRKYPGTEILKSDNLKKPKDTGINSEGSERTISSLRRLRRVSNERISSTKELKFSRQDHCSRTLQYEDLNEIKRSEISFDDSETKVLRKKHFNLSLRHKKNIFKENEDRREDSYQPSTSTQLKYSDPINVNHMKRLIKRKLIDTEDTVSTICKLNKFEEEQTAMDSDSSEESDFDLFGYESNTSRYLDQKDALKGPQVDGNKNGRQKVRCKFQNKAPIVKNLRVSLEKMKGMAYPRTSKQIDNVNSILNRCIDTYEPDVDFGIDFSDTKDEDLGKNCFDKTRNTKITDYFFKIDKSRVVSENNNRKFDQIRNDLMLKEKYGICKDAFVSLIDLKKLKISGSGYSAFEIEKSTQEYANSFINNNFTIAMPNQNETVLFSNNFSSSLDDIIITDVQSSIDFENLLPVHDNVDETSRGAFKTQTDPVAKNLSPKGHKSLRVNKDFSSKSSQNSINHELSSTEFPNLLSERDDVNKLTRDSLQTHIVSIENNLLPLISQKSPQLKKLKVAENRQDSSNENLYVNIRRRLRSRKEKELLDRMEHSKDSSFVIENSNLDKELPEKDSLQKNSSELTANSQSSLTNVNKFENHSSESRDNNTTPKSSNSVSRKEALSTVKNIVLINDEMESNESRVSTTNKSPKTNKVQEKNDDTPRTDNFEDLLDGNELRNESNKNSVLDDGSNAVIDRSDTRPVCVSVIRSPMKLATPRNYLKPETPRHIPANSMTFLSREIMEENSSWLGLDKIIEDVIETSISAATDDTIDKNEASDVMTSVNTKKNKTVTSPKENLKDTNLSSSNRDSTESPDSNKYLIKLLASKSAECFSLKQPGEKEIETCLSEKNALTVNKMVEKKLHGVERSDTELEKTTTMPKLPNLIPIEPVEESSESISAEINNQDRDQDRENSNCQDENPTDSMEDGQLLIDTDDNDSNLQPVEDVMQGKSSPSSSADSTILQDEETGKNTKKSSKIKCIICKKTFRNVKGLEQHLKIHIRRMNGCCLICDKPLNKKHHQSVIIHYLEHCGCLEDGKPDSSTCGICNQKFSRKSGLTNHLKTKHKSGKNKSSAKKTDVNYNKCDICQLTCDTEEDLHSHVYKHTEQELQDAFKAAMAKRQNMQSESTKNKDDLTSESTVASNTSPRSNCAIQNCEVSICMCHKDERLEISGGILIEIALACIQCKTFFKSSGCLKNHYSHTSCKLSDNNLVVPKMFCSKCCVILNNLEEMHLHVAKHGDLDVSMKTSSLCKHCNIFFFSIGSSFYSHWHNHLNNPLYIADLYTFPNNIKVKIVETGNSKSVDEDEPTESLLIADHQCHTCQRPFQTENDLKQHVNSKNSCSKKVDSESENVENIKSVFNLICSICNKEFIDKLTFDAHVEEHDTIKGFLQAPKELEKSSGNKPLTCSICKTEYETILNYKEHLIRHEVIQEKFLCNYCNLMMDSVEDFEHHSGEHKGTPEKPIACKVIFATAKFHCKPCKIWFDSQSVLDEHLATHKILPVSSPRTVENSTAKIVPDVDLKSYVCETCQEKFDDQLKLNTHILTHKKDISDKPTVVDPILVHLSDDSNSTDIEIIDMETNVENVKPVVEIENTLIEGEQEKINQQENKRPAFLRVKNLEELLPYACSKCKSEFDTQINLNKHVCTPHVESIQNKNFKYSCTVCKNYQSNNDSEWNVHLLTHFPLRSSEKLDDNWYYVLKMRSGTTILKCNICPIYECTTVTALRHHFLISHRDIYRPTFKCRVCRTFKTEREQEIRRHEAAHFQNPSSFQQITNLGEDSANAQPIQLTNNCQQPLPIPHLTSTANNISILQQVENFDISQRIHSMLLSLQTADKPNNLPQQGLNPSVTRSGNNLPLLRPLPNFTNPSQRPEVPTLQSDNNSNNHNQQSISIPPATSLGYNFSKLQVTNNANNFQQPVSNSTAISTVNNSSSIQSAVKNSDNSKQLDSTRKLDDKSNDVQQIISVPSTTNSNSKQPPLQSVDNSNTVRYAVWIPPAASSSSSDNSSSLQPPQISNNSQQPVLNTLIPNSNCNNFQQSISIPSVTISGSNLSTIQQVDISNKFQHPVAITANAGSDNNLPPLQPLQGFNNSQQPGSTVQSNNSSNDFQQLISAPSTTSSGYSSSSSPSMNNPQWLSATSQTFQIQVNNGAPFNNMTNMMHAVPMYVTNVTYCCRICKTYKCSSEQDLKVHEAMHEYIQSRESSKRLLYRCKFCTNILCPTEEHLKMHMQLYHKTDKSNVSQNQTQSDVNDTQLKCKHCHQTFVTSAQLNQHVYISHTIPGRQQSDNQFQNSYPHTCEICGVGFLNEAFLQAHVRQIHPTIKIPRHKINDPTTLYQCSTCGLLLISEATLSYHMRSHSIGLQ